jgi:hypothetical protein
MQRQHEEAVVHGVLAEHGERGIDGYAQRPRLLALGRGAGMLGHLRGIDRAEKERDLLVGGARGRQTGEQLGERGGRDPDLALLPPIFRPPCIGTSRS